MSKLGEILHKIISVFKCRSKCCSGSECICGDYENKRSNIDEVHTGHKPQKNNISNI